MLSLPRWTIRSDSSLVADNYREWRSTMVLKMFRVWLVGFCIGGALCASTALAEKEAGPAPDISGIHLNTKGFSSSRQCGQCHKELYDDWKHSLHADASGNAIFQAAYMQVYFECHVYEATFSECLLPQLLTLPYHLLTVRRFQVPCSITDQSLCDSAFLLH